MEITVNHVVTLSPETIEILRSFASAEAKPVTAKTKSPVKPETPVVAMPAPEPVAAPVPVTQADIKQAVEGPAMEEVRAKAQDLAKAGHKDKIKNELTALGAANVPALDRKHYPAFMAFLDTLESI